MKRIYLVRRRASMIPRLVRAYHPAHALRLVAAEEFTVAVATQDELVEHKKARAKADAVFMAHRDEVHAQLHDLYVRMIKCGRPVGTNEGVILWSTNSKFLTC